MQGKRTSDDLAKSIYRLMQTRIMQTQQLLGFSRFSSQHFSHGTPFFLKNRDIRNRVAVQDVLTNAQKDRRVNWCRRHLFFDFTKGIFSVD